MAKLYNLARVATATIGLGNVTLGPAVSGYLTWALAGVQNGDVVSYALHDFTAGVLTASEAGRGTYIAATNTFSRDTVLDSTNGGAKIPLTGSAQAIITILAEDYTALEIGADPAGTAAASMVAHLAAGNPHPQYIITETDPVFSASPSFSITALDIAAWNAKQSALSFPLVASLGGLGINNGSATLTLPNFPITIAGGLSGAVYTLPATSQTLAGLAVSGQTFTTAQKINVNSTTALLVEQTGVKNNTLVVDTTNGRVGIGGVPTAPLHVIKDSSANDLNIIFDASANATTAAIYDFIGNRNTVSTAIGNLRFYNTGTGSYPANPAVRITVIRNSSTLTAGSLSVLIGADTVIRANENKRVGLGENVTSPAGQVHIKSSTATNIGFIVQGAASQSANIEEHQDSTGAIHNRFNIAGTASAYENVFNETGSPYLDFRVETDNYNALFVDASNDSIVIMSNAAGKVSLFGVPVIVQPAGANQAALTNSTGGAYDATLIDVGLVFSQANINDNFTDVYTLLTEIRTALVNIGIIKGSA